MIIVMKPNAPQDSISQVASIIETCGLTVHLSQGKEVTILGVVGDKAQLDTCAIQLNPSVEKIVSITESYKLSNRKFHPLPVPDLKETHPVPLSSHKPVFFYPAHLTLMSNIWIHTFSFPAYAFWRRNCFSFIFS